MNVDRDYTVVFNIFKNQDNKYLWRAKTINGFVLFTSINVYNTRTQVLNAIVNTSDAVSVTYIIIDNLFGYRLEDNSGNILTTSTNMYTSLKEALHMVDMFKTADYTIIQETSN